MAASPLFDAAEPPVLTGARVEGVGPLTLRPWTPDDAPAVQAAYSDGAIQRWHARRLGTVAEARGLLAQWRARWDSRSGASWAVVSADGTLLARTELNAFDLRDGVAGASYWAVPAARGQGVVPAALRVAVSWAFAAGFHRLELEHSTRNAASCRAAVRAGLDAEGVRRGAVRHDDGWHDMHVHALVNPSGTAESAPQPVWA
ncbi:N-acetyltransferase [Xylanimonas oleitrophica]|uniref:N-acetyltransferase n=1 Tax=Xylanimonas oleitrophica TaxID=2607479 RepID=A0A2W5WM99_9MICO|nr:N-acetyltransferase [Xylanimonas oleitrophica]